MIQCHVRAAIGLVVLALALSGCADEPEAIVAAKAQEKPTPEQEFQGLIELLGSPSAPPEVLALAVRLLADYSPDKTIEPFMALLGTDEPILLVAVIESLPHAAESAASAELEFLVANHPDSGVQAAARERLAGFEAFHQ